VALRRQGKRIVPIFKYFTHETHARAFMHKGILLLRPLSYFRAEEDGLVRGDPHDGTLAYAPARGLEINREDGTILNLEGARFTSSAVHDAIFVFCASKEMSFEIVARFQSPYCVEITEPSRIVERLKRRDKAGSDLDYLQTIAGEVDYRNHERAPEADWALPEKLAFIKPEGFAWQAEYRIALGKKGTFDAQNVTCTIEIGEGTPAAEAAIPRPLKLKIGCLTDFTRLHVIDEPSPDT
jgi:hypothetical protein